MSQRELGSFLDYTVMLLGTSWDVFVFIENM